MIFIVETNILIMYKWFSQIRHVHSGSIWTQIKPVTLCVFIAVPPYYLKKSASNTTINHPQTTPSEKKQVVVPSRPLRKPRPLRTARVGMICLVSAAEETWGCRRYRAGHRRDQGWSRSTCRAVKRSMELYIHGKRMAMVTNKDVPTIKNMMMNV